MEITAKAVIFDR